MILDLMEKAKIFFKRNGLLLNWKEFEKLIKSKNKHLAMIAPLLMKKNKNFLKRFL